MTTFHDILGTNSSTPIEEVKRQYKLLCSRNHPDKGGSNALMQLVVNAYEQVIAGKGDGDALQKVAAATAAPQGQGQDNNELWQKRCKLLELKYTQCMHEKKQLEAKLQTMAGELEAARRQVESSSPKKGASDGELQTLRNENRRLQSQVSSLNAELAECNATTRMGNEFKTDEDTKQTENKENNREPRRDSAAKRKVFVVLVVLLVVSALGFLNKDTLSAWLFPSPESNQEKPLVKVEPNPEDLARELAERQRLAAKKVVEKPIEPRIRLANSVGVWTLAEFENVSKPYISVRSEDGSYIVKSCTEDFKYYKSMTRRSSRMPSNLIFERRDRHFEIYGIPYGNGAAASNWTNSKSLMVNNEYFANTDFEAVYYELQMACM